MTSGRPRPQTSILQALTLMNGSYIDGATNPATSQVSGRSSMAPFLDTPGQVEMLFLATLTRRPTADERAALVRFVERPENRRRQGESSADVFWALLNGPEFHFNH